MFKAKVDSNHVEIEIAENLEGICASIAKIISTVNERLSENDPKLGYMFRCVLTKGFMEGHCFNDDREHMEHYLADADRREETYNKSHGKIMEALDDLINAMRDARDSVQEAKDAMDKAQEEVNKATEPKSEEKKDDVAE